MAEVIFVDFKNKTRVRENTNLEQKDFTSYAWIDALTCQAQEFNSRCEDNVAHVKIPLYVREPNGEVLCKEFIFSTESIQAIYEEVFKDGK